MKKILLTITLVTSLLVPEILLADEWTIRAGGMILTRPEYEGSDSNDVEALPIIDISYGKMFFLNFRKGLGVNVIKNKYMELGGSIGYYRDREEDDSTHLRGLQDIDSGFDGRFFTSVFLDKFSLSLEFRGDLSDNHHGTLWILGAGYSVRRDEAIDLDLGISSTYADDDYMQTYFGITPGQSAASGLREFPAAGAFKDFTWSANARLKLSRDWNAIAFFSHSILMNDAKESPLVRDVGSDNQFRLGVGVDYKF